MLTIFITNGMYLSFSCFMPCPEPPICISSVVSIPEWDGGSLVFSSFFMCNKLVLNRVFLYFRCRYRNLAFGQMSLSGHLQGCWYIWRATGTFRGQLVLWSAIRTSMILSGCLQSIPILVEGIPLCFRFRVIRHYWRNTCGRCP